MSGSTASYITARFLLAEYIVRGQDNVISCPLYQDGALVAPDSSGTGTVYDENDEVIYTGTATVSGSIASITVPAASVPSTLEPTSGWHVEFVLTISGVDRTLRNKAHLVLSELYPVVTDVDLFRRQPQLNPSASGPLTADADFQDYLDEAWVILVARITNQGPLPFLVMEPTALREAHLTLALALIFEANATTLEGSDLEANGEHYREQYDTAWRELRFEYDQDRDGKADGKRKRSATAVLWTC